jgi:Abnormal spindle-like microcephaly-assoc'd, ASPM-SPD-2-Hydin
MKQAIKDQNLSLLLILILCAGVLAGCSKGGLTGSSSTTGSTPTPTPTPTPGTGALTSTPGSVNFGNIVLNITSGQTVKVSNAGNAAVNITQDNLTGSGMSAGLTTPLNLAAGQSVNVQINFAPTVAGAVSGSLVLLSNGTTVLTIPLSGTGVTPQPHSVAISWNASTTSGLQGYNVYRSQTSGGPYTKISSTLSPTTLTFTDTTPVSGQKFFYIVTAVNSSGLESIASNEVAVNIPTP